MDQVGCIWSDIGTAPVILLAIELSKQCWLVAVYDPTTDKVSRHRLAAGDVNGLIRLAEKAKRVAAARAGGPVDLDCVYEAGYDGFWLQRWLTQTGVPCRVMDPASLKVDRRARRVKTDRIDVESLLRALQAWRRGDRQACKSCGCLVSSRKTPAAHIASLIG